MRRNTDTSTGDDEWVIWNGGLGLVTTATLGRVEAGTSGRQAWLEEPFDMVGPFSLDELETHGRIAFAACIVMSRQRWQEDQAALRYESMNMRRAAQEQPHRRERDQDLTAHLLLLFFSKILWTVC